MCHQRRIAYAPALGAFLAVCCIGTAEVSALTKIRAYIIAGQSNSIGWNPGGAAQLPDSLKQPQPNIRVCAIYADGTAHGADAAGPYALTHGWTDLRPQWFGGGCEVGPSLSFGYDMQKARPADSIVIIHPGKVSALADAWLPPSSPGGPGEMFTGMIKGIRQQLAYLGPNYQCEIAGMMWMQGELDAANGTGSTYAVNLINLIKDTRDSLHLSNLPFVIGQISLHDWGSDVALVRSAQASVAATVAHTKIVDTKDFDIASDGHYTAAGQVQLGDGFAREMLRLLNAQTGVRSGSKQNRRRSIQINRGCLSVDRPSTLTLSDVRGRTIRNVSVTGASEVDLRTSHAGTAIVAISNDGGRASRVIIQE